MTVQFRVDARKDHCCLLYYLQARINEGYWWQIKEFKSAPAESTITELKEFFIRSCSLYHEALEIPRFRLEEV